MENRKKQLSLIALITIAAFGHFLIDFMLSIWPVYKTMARLDLAMAGLIAVVSMVCGELMQLPFGRLIDRGYQKQLFVAGVLLASAAVLFPYVGGYFFYFLLILLTCVGSAAFHPTAASILSGLQSKRKALFFGIFQMAGNFGMGTGQIFFAGTYDLLDGHTAVLLLPAFALAGFIALSKLTEEPTIEGAQKARLRDILQFFRDRSLRSLYFVQVCNQAIIWSMVFLLPDLLLSRGFSKWLVFGGGHFTFLLGAALGCLPVGAISNRFTPAKTIFVSFILATFCYYCFLAVPSMAPSFVLILLFLIGAFLGSMTPLALALGGELAPQNRGLVSAFLMGMVWIVSETIGIGCSGFLADCFYEDAPAKALACLGLLLFVGTTFAYKLISSRESATVEIRDDE